MARHGRTSFDTCQSKEWPEIKLIIMADLHFESALNNVLFGPSETGFMRSLRKEQKEVIQQLASGGDLLAVLPTGFGKSLIFQLLVRVQEAIRKKPSCVIVVCPLKSIVQDQIGEVVSMGLTTVLLPEANLEDIESCQYNLLFASAEEVLDKKFLSSVKKPNTNFHDNLAAIIVDESHTVETWTGKR